MHGLPFWGQPFCGYLRSFASLEIEAVSSANAVTVAVISAAAVNETDNTGVFDENTAAVGCDMKSRAAVSVAANAPCSILPAIYGFRLRPESEVTAIT